MREEATGNHDLAKWLGGIAIGAIAMYLADPMQGRRRRALAQDKMRKFTHKTSDVVSAVLHDAGNRLYGLQAEASRMMGYGMTSKPIDNHVLEARVRSKLGRAMINSDSINVTAEGGKVTLRGTVPLEDKQHVVQLVRGIPGVLEVRDKLHVENEGNERGTQENFRTYAEEQSDFSGVWMLALLGGGLLGYYGLTRRNSSGQLLAVAGLSALARALGGGNLPRAFAGTDADVVEVEKTIDIKASPETVFDVWTRYENFPHFMSHVIEVRDLGHRRSHWIVRGPGNSMLEWDSVLTQSERPTVLAWRSEPGAEIENTGSVTLEPYKGGTRTTVRMTYRPPAGAIGQGIATVLGANPEQELEDDLARMKRFIESGVPTRDAMHAGAGHRKILH